MIIYKNFYFNDCCVIVNLMMSRCNVSFDFVPRKNFVMIPITLDMPPLLLHKGGEM